MVKNFIEDFYKFKTSADVVVVGLFRDLQSAASKQFITVALLVDSVYFGISSNSSVFDTVVLFYSIVVFKKFDEGRADFDGQFNADEIKKFIHANQLALVFIQENSIKRLRKRYSVVRLKHTIYCLLAERALISIQFSLNSKKQLKAQRNVLF